MTATRAARCAGPLALGVLLLASIMTELHGQGLAARWDFEGRDAAIAAESTERGYDFVLQGVERVRGAVDKGIHFFGPTSSVVAPLPDVLQSPEAVTVEAWVRSDKVSGDVEGAGIVNAGNYLMRITRGTPSFHVFTTGWGPVLAESPAPEGRWLHLVGTYDGAHLRIYVNGELSGSVERTGAIAPSKAPLILGRQANPFTGAIDEVRIYLEALTPSQVKARFDASCRDLNPGIEPGVSVHVYEGPLHEPVRLPDPPPALQPFARERVTGRAPGDVGASLLALQASLARPEASPHALAELAPPRSWLPAEEIGCTRVLLWPPPASRSQWEAFHQAMGPSRPRGLTVTVPVPAHMQAMQAVWSQLSTSSDHIGVLVVENGMPTDPARPMASWKPLWSNREWMAAARELRRCAPPTTGIVLARLPLMGRRAAPEIARAAASAKGLADAVCVWVTLEGDSEASIESALRTAQAAVRDHGLELWLDAACAASVPDPERTIRFLRLLAVCHELRVPVTWWNGDDLGSLDRYGQHTRLSFAAQAWQSIVSAPTREPSVETTDGGARIVRWAEAGGKVCVAWWDPRAETEEIGALSAQLPADAEAVDPLHALRLDLPPGGPLPLCRWPLIARGSARQ